MFFPGKSQGQRRLVGYSPWGCERVRHDLVTEQQTAATGLCLLRTYFFEGKSLDKGLCFFLCWSGSAFWWLDCGIWNWTTTGTVIATITALEVNLKSYSQFLWKLPKFIHQIRSVAQSCLTLCNPMNRSTLGLPVHHQLPEFTETHVHQVSDAIQPSHPLLSPSPPAPNPSQHQSLFQWANSSHEVAKVLEFQI